MSTQISTPQTSMQLKAFLCHASKDKIRVRQLYANLRTQNIDPWLDEEDLIPGQKWEDEIPRAVRSSHVVIVCLSNSSVSHTGFVQKEIKYALDIADEQAEDSIFIIPVRLEDCNVPERLRQWHWVDLYEDKGFEKLIKALRVRAKNLGLPDTISKEAVNLLQIPMNESNESGMNINEFEKVIQNLLPFASQDGILLFSRILVDSFTEKISLSEAQAILNDNKSLRNLVKQLSGQEINTSNAVLSFGIGNQMGDIKLRDIAGRDILNFTINIDSEFNNKKSISNNLLLNVFTKTRISITIFVVSIIYFIVVVFNIISPHISSGSNSIKNEIICDDQDACFSKHESGGVGAWGYIPANSVGSSGAYNGHAYWTYNGLNSATDWGLWTPKLPQTGTYDVYIWYPHYPGIAPETNSAHYQVHDTGGDQAIIWNQAVNYGQWNKIATVNCTADTTCFVKLTDATIESTSTHRVWFDAVKFVPTGHS